MNKGREKSALDGNARGHHRTGPARVPCACPDASRQKTGHNHRGFVRAKA
ncbi:hypothetical protein SAMN00767673_3033 [Rubrobacter radiotolerans DSM 5868]|nr:hypothetical protein SAMN00767673_3033 [Rubrobacter radiotolerans DSM 5868]